MIFKQRAKFGGKQFRFVRGLVDNGAAIDDIHEPPRNGRTVSPRDEPKRHDHGLAQAGRDVAADGLVS